MVVRRKSKVSSKCKSKVKCEFLICRYFQKGKYISTKDCYMILTRPAQKDSPAHIKTWIYTSSSNTQVVFHYISWCDCLPCDNLSNFIQISLFISTGCCLISSLKSCFVCRLVPFVLRAGGLFIQFIMST